jgi:hypothetical protein
MSRDEAQTASARIRPDTLRAIRADALIGMLTQPTVFDVLVEAWQSLSDKQRRAAIEKAHANLQSTAA